MREFERQGGVAFFLISFDSKNEMYYLTFRQLDIFWKRQEDGGRHSFRYDELDRKFIIKSKPGVFVPYLDYIQLDLDNRE